MKSVHEEYGIAVSSEVAKETRVVYQNYRRKLKRRDSTELLQQQQKLLLENPAPFVTAQSWVLFNQVRGEVMFGKCENEPRQIASLTKIMTSLIVLDAMKSLYWS